MPFGTLVSGAQNFAPRADGIYMLDSVAFGSPENYFLFRPASRRDDVIRVAHSRVLEKDNTVNGAIVRQATTWTLSGNVPASGFTTTEIRNLITDISNAYTAAILSRHLQGEV